VGALTKRLVRLEALRGEQFAPREQAERDQQSRLAALLNYAERFSPYYADLLRGGTQFDELPFLDRGTLRTHFEDLRSRDRALKRTIATSSGGSTGEPVTVLQDAYYADWWLGAQALFDEWAGYRLGEPRVVLWGAERDILHGRASVRTAVWRWLRNETFVNVFRATAEDYEACARRMGRLRPAMVLAYASAAYEFARFARSKGIALHGPRSVMTTAETLSPEMRREIEDVFGAAVFNRYGTRELGDLACECDRHLGLHVSMPTHVVEIIRPDGSPAPAGEVGEVVVTALQSRAMPLIRYRTGDLANFSARMCSCGRSWPLLERIVGRTIDVFLALDGRRVHGVYFGYLVIERPWIARFQVVQTSSGSVEVRIVLAAGAVVPTSDAQEIADGIRAAMGHECAVEIKVVERIEPGPTGKHRSAISFVDASWDT
jgi:phenylacetate-CoA ligase